MTPSHNPLSDRTIELVAERFRILGDPLRLRLLQTLGNGERSVAELVEASGASQANVSKHLSLLLKAGVVARRKAGLFVYYSVRDPHVFQLCDVVCGSLAESLKVDLRSLEPEGSSGTAAAGASGKGARARRGLPRRSAEH